MKYNCKNCNKGFDKPILKYRYTSFCSHSCYLVDYYRRFPKKFIQHFSNKWFNKKENLKCCICGFDRAFDFAHLKWRKDGGRWTKKNLIILCPNHHRLFDRGKLNPKEKKIIKAVIDSK